MHCFFLAIPRMFYRKIDRLIKNSPRRFSNEKISTHLFLLQSILKVVGNEKIGGSGKCQMLEYGSGLWRWRFIFCLNMQFLS